MRHKTAPLPLIRHHNRHNRLIHCNSTAITRPGWIRRRGPKRPNIQFHPDRKRMGIRKNVPIGLEYLASPGWIAIISPRQPLERVAVDYLMRLRNTPAPTPN